MTPEQTATVLSAGAALIGALAAVVSAVAAVIAVRAQRRGMAPQVRVTHSTAMLAYGSPGMPGAHLGDEPWLTITVHNSGILPVTVTSARLICAAGNAPFFGPKPGMGGGSLPARLDPGEEVTLMFDELRRVARLHVSPEQGPVTRAEATIAGGRSFEGPAIKDAWLRGWARE